MVNFGNHPNMGYCVFNNTSLGIRQILDGLEEVQTPQDATEMLEGLNTDERRRYHEMLDLAEALKHELERIDELALEDECDEELEEDEME